MPAQRACAEFLRLPLRRRLLTLALTFMRMGAVTFGGGYVIVAMLDEDLVRRRGWMTSGELADMVTVAESTPGPIAVNTATFVGYRLGGVWGGLTATVALVFPAWLTIVILSHCYLLFNTNAWVAAALSGIRIAAVVLVLRAFLRMGVKSCRSLLDVLLCVGAFGAVAFAGISALWVLALGLGFGLLWYGLRPWVRFGGRLKRMRGRQRP